MFRSLIFAIGIFLLIFGVQTLLVDKWIMSYELPPSATAANNGGYYNSPYRTAAFSRIRGNQNQYGQNGRLGNAIKPVYQTQDWMPWSLLAGGSIIVLYTYSSGRREE